MKKKIAILGSTGSIGKSLLSLISKDIGRYDIILLTANKNYRELLNQTIKFKVRNVIISDPTSYQFFKNKNKNNNIKIFNNYDSFNKIFKNKIDYAMNSIVGLEGLEPNLKIIKHTKNLAIANKESIICGWNLIKKKLNKFKTSFIPVDSEHYSIWYAICDNKNLIEKIYLTASGGPFLNLAKNKFSKIKTKDALKHPNWKMGKKISVDSATMMNKVFELIEAKKIFDINYKKISILIHPKSYVHAILEFQNGLIKLVAHDTNMKIPIFNSLHDSKKALDFFKNKIEIDKLNNLALKKVDTKRFPLTNIIKQLPKQDSLFETVLVSANDELVNQFLGKKIKFNDISKILLKFLKNDKMLNYKHISPNNFEEIMNLNNYVRLKIRSKYI